MWSPVNNLEHALKCARNNDAYWARKWISAFRKYHLSNCGEAELRAMFPYMQELSQIPCVSSSVAWRKFAQAYEARCLEVFQR